jgi:carbon monoxide dehydrogenase subunit G
MEIKGEYRIAAPREKVFAALNDQAVLQACIPGCESLEKTSDTEMKAKVRMRIGPVSASFSGKVTLSDIDPPNGYRISGEGQGGAAGFAKGGAVVTLREDAGETLLNYNVDAQVGGKIAQVGARLIDGTAKKLADEFFGKFATMVGGPPPASAVAGTASDAPPAPDTVSPPSPPPAAAQRGYRHWLVIGIGAAVLILIFLASR